jgi:hypothetical protein
LCSSAQIVENNNILIELTVLKSKQNAMFIARKQHVLNYMVCHIDQYLIMRLDYNFPVHEDVALAYSVFIMLCNLLYLAYVHSDFLET